jgi:hypothetical protein
LVRLLADKARSGVAARLLLADPGSRRMAERGAEEGIGDAVAARVLNGVSLSGTSWRPRVSRLASTTRCSTTRSSGPSGPREHRRLRAPELHLRRVEASGMFSTYVDCFERG